MRTIWTLPVDGGKPTRVTDDEHLNWNPVWSPDGKFLYFASNRGGPMNLWRVPIDEDSGALRGEPEPLGAPAQWSALLSFSHDGRRFVYATDNGSSNIVRMQLDPRTDKVFGEPTAVTEGAQAVDSLDASPDGNWLAFTTTGPQEDLFVMHSDGTDLRKLTTGTTKNRVPRWSSDGALIAFYSDRGGSFQGWTIKPDGSDLKLISDASPLFNPVWSPDGKHLACNVGAHHDLSLIDLTLPMAQRRPVPLAARTQPFYGFSWSRDGERLLGVTDQDPGVFVYSFAARRYDRLTHGLAQSASWLHDGSVLYLAGGKLMVVDSRKLTSREVYAPEPNWELRGACASPDGRAIYAIRSTQEGDIWLGTFP